MRLCNVLGSTGSVAPLFARQIAAGGPVTVTDRRATRYFISRDVAVRHLLCSALRSAPGALFVPVAGAPRRVEDLATYLLHRIEAPNHSVNIVHTGLRISDKLHERLIAPTESVSPLKDDSSLLAVRSLFEPEALQHGLSEIRSAVAGRRQDQLLRAMQHVVPEYRPQILSRTGA